MRRLDQPEMGAAEPWWLNLELFGFEDDDDDDLDDEEDDVDEDEEEDEEDEDSDEDEDDEDSDEEEEDEDDEDEKSKKSKKSKNIAGLKSALRKERMARKRAERDLRRARARQKNQRQGQGSSKSKSKKDNGNNSNNDHEEQDQEETGPSEREVRLAARLLTQAVDQEILAVASTMKFVDPQDAVRLVNRKDIVADQDDEDPTEIEIDRESIEDAVKDLAKKKKHLINRGGSGGGKTGSRVGGRRKSGEPNDAAIRERYGLGPARR